MLLRVLPRIHLALIRSIRVSAFLIALAFAVPALGSDASSELSPAPAVDWRKEQEFWSFQPPVRHPVPRVKQASWPRQPVDYFVLSQMETQSLSPSGEADRRTLIRRLSFDLMGLPPAPEEIEDFLSDDQPGAYERLVEKLLASPRFGERLASLWLTLARYAEDQAHQVGTDTKYFYPNAFKYRQWVIDAFNRDLPYDQFLLLQLAADKYLPQFATASPSPEEYAGEDENAAEKNPEKPAEPAPLASIENPSSRAPGRQLAGITPDDLAALGFLGLGPKYYNRNRIDVMADEWEDRVDTVTRTMLGLTVACARCHDHKFEPITTEDYYALAGVFASTKMVNKTPDGLVEKGETKAEEMKRATLHIVEDDKAQDLNVFIRGNVDRKGPVVERRFLQILCGGEAEPFQNGSGRKELAEAIACRENPLTARVLVNRIWAAFFGQALVGTPSNLGHSGMRPSHPELLDDLAVRFMENGWSIKELVRELVTSSTYRQASRNDAQKAKIDAGNEQLWRMNRRRLTVEQWRDSVLYVAGNLDLLGGPSLELDDPANHRRTLHARVSRLELNSVLMSFDYPDANVHAEQRAVTTTPMQKLFVLNHPFMLEQSGALARRLAGAPDQTPAESIERAYQLLYGREPNEEEVQLGLAFVRPAQGPGAGSWEQYAQVLLASNEMLYVD